MAADWDALIGAVEVVPRCDYCDGAGVVPDYGPFGIYQGVKECRACRGSGCRERRPLPTPPESGS